MCNYAYISSPQINPVKKNCRMRQLIKYVIDSILIESCVLLALTMAKSYVIVTRQLLGGNPEDTNRNLLRIILLTRQDD